ncbi:HigA family addiction module antidote protein [Chitinophaga oryziterrae]|uniref:HigA family addiction module antidote protein n=1 Tax=Chitinophaga oryziterrae TaxID=1031224 RepID=A0A6N8JDQ2_9BACT|nr:HigA family addiction module antitoxin [Chitinophaga oryziterrae]MVT43074.1 HigA family addiction module antidote protein [Chitinophaga oryziterrae]
MKRKMKPSHPGAILREDVLKEMNLTVTKAAEILQVSRKQLSEVANEKAGVSPEMAWRLELAFGIEAQLWLDLQSQYDLWKVQESGKVAHIARYVPGKAM